MAVMPVSLSPTSFSPSRCYATFRFRGGWQLNGQLERDFADFQDSSYARYSVGGAAGPGYRPAGDFSGLVWQAGVTTPTWQRLGANLFFQLVSRRYERGSILITSNQSLTGWGQVFGDQVIATAILDRLLHHSTIINIKGESFRLREKRKAGLLGRRTKANGKEGGDDA